jgi:nitroreductase
MSELSLEQNIPEDNCIESSVGSQVLDVIQSRRSLREDFIDKPIPRDVIAIIVESGLTAPSSKNAQPWRLHVVDDQNTLQAIAQDVLDAKQKRAFVPHDPRTGKPRPEFTSTVRESGHTLGKVALGIIVENRGDFSVNRAAVAHANGNLEGLLFGYGLEYIGLGACIQNMWLAAHSQGLGGVFMGDVGIAETAIQQRLGFDGDLVGALALGWGQTPYGKRSSFREDAVVYHSPQGDA